MIISIAQAQTYFLVLTRILALIIHMPVLGSQTIPIQVRLGTGLLLAMIMVPWQPLPPEATALSLLAFAAAIAKEILIGTLAGFAAALTFGAVQIAGETIGIGSGFGSSRVFNPTLGEAGTDFNQLFIMFAMMIFLLMNGHHLFLSAMARTFEVAPVNGSIAFNSLDELLSMFSRMVVSGVQMAMPLLTALLMTDLVLGLLARIAPQIQVFFLGLPLKVGVSLIGLSLLFVIVSPSLVELYRGLGDRMLRLLAR